MSHPLRLSAAALILLIAVPAQALDYYVATTGSNSNPGSAEAPWATIQYALSRVTGGDAIIVRDGIYNGGISSRRSFTDWVTIKAEHPLRAKLTNIQGAAARNIVYIYTPGSVKLAIEGFIFSNTVPGYACGEREPYYLVQFESAEDLILRNNILAGNTAPGGCNELLKINRSGDPYYPKNIVVQGNLFYDHASSPGADMIDSVRPGEVDIVENIFFGRNAPNAQSFITLKTETLAENLNIQPRSPRYNVSRNVFLNWEGRTDQAFIQLGEDTYAQYMITDALIENNLLIGNAARQMAGPFQLKGPKNVTIRANTIVGNYQNNTTYGIRVGTEGSNIGVRDIFIYNNIWDDPTGTMSARFINAYGNVVLSSIRLDRNLFWNAGKALPGSGPILPSADANLLNADPLLPAGDSAIVLPVFDESSASFPSGNTTIRQEFERLVLAHGALPPGSAAIDNADSRNMPSDDILGHRRDDRPDIGAYEYSAAPPEPTPITSTPTVTPAPTQSPVPTVPGKRDTKRPRVKILRQTAAARHAGRRTVVISGRATDDVAVAAVQYQLNRSKRWKQAAGTEHWTIRVRNRSGRRLTLRVRAIDTAGNISSIVTRRYSKT